MRPLLLGESKAKLARLVDRRLTGIVLNEHTEEDGATVFRHACKFGRRWCATGPGLGKGLRAIPATWQGRVPVAGMSAHKFKIGQFVNYNPRPSGLGVRSDHPAGAYQIAQLMPPVVDEPQYRIKSEAEGHLRSAMESELSPLNRL